MSHCYCLPPSGLYLQSSWPPHFPLWLCHRVCSCFQILQSWSDSWGVGKAWPPQRPTLRAAPRQEEELEAAPRPKSVRQETVGALGTPGLDGMGRRPSGLSLKSLTFPLGVHLGQDVAQPSCQAHCHSSCYWAMDSCCQDMDLVLITVSANTVNLLLRERVFENVHSGYNFSAAAAVCAQLIPDTELWNSNDCIYKKARTHKYVTSGIYNAIFHHFLF